MVTEWNLLMKNTRDAVFWLALCLYLVQSMILMASVPSGPEDVRIQWIKPPYSLTYYCSVKCGNAVKKNAIFASHISTVLTQYCGSLFISVPVFQKVVPDTIPYPFLSVQKFLIEKQIQWTFAKNCNFKLIIAYNLSTYTMLWWYLKQTKLPISDTATNPDPNLL